MRQVAPEPTALRELVEKLGYRPGWIITLEDIDRGQGCQGLTLVVTTKGYNSYHPEHGETYRVHHYMPVPPAAYNAVSWRRWLFDQLQLVERHECAEFFAIDGERPYAPNHGFGHDPYTMFEKGSIADADTSFRDERLHPAS